MSFENSTQKMFFYKNFLTSQTALATSTAAIDVIKRSSGKLHNLVSV